MRTKRETQSKAAHYASTKYDPQIMQSQAPFVSLIYPDKLHQLPTHSTAKSLYKIAISDLQCSQGNFRINSLIGSQIPLKNSDVDRYVQRDWIDTALDFGKSLAKGVYSVGEDLIGGTARTARGLNFFDPEEQERIGAENERAFDLLKSIVTNHDAIEKLALTLVEYFYDNLPSETQDKVKSALIKKGLLAATYLTGRMYIGKKLASFLIQKIMVYTAELATELGVSSTVAETGVGIPVSLLMIQGTLERAAQASRRLAKQFPILHRILAQENLDMIWFLIEPHFDELHKQFMDQIQGTGKDSEANEPLPPGDYLLPDENVRPT